MRAPEFGSSVSCREVAGQRRRRDIETLRQPAQCGKELKLLNPTQARQCFDLRLTGTRGEEPGDGRGCSRNVGAVESRCGRVLIESEAVGAAGAAFALRLGRKSAMSRIW